MKARFILLLFSLSLIMTKSFAQPCPKCACSITIPRPSMIITDPSNAIARDLNYKLLKAKYLDSNFPQEIKMELAELISLFSKTINTTIDKVSGIRVYFAQTEAKKLSLIFVTTRYDNQRELDNSDYQLFAFNPNGSHLVPISASDMTSYTTNYEIGFIKDQGTLPPVNGLAMNETRSLFYTTEMIQEMYTVLTGCLKESVKGVSIKFVAYAPEDIVSVPAKWKDWAASPKTGPADNKLLIHFVFKDCKGNNYHFTDCNWYTKQDGDADTALPCPDFCPDQINH